MFKNKIDEMNAALAIENSSYNRGATTEEEYKSNIAAIYEAEERDDCQFPNDVSGCNRHPKSQSGA